MEDPNQGIRMRAAFGLVSLLVVLGIIMLVFNFYSAPMLKQGKATQDQARQIAGRDEDNAPVTDAITLDAKDRNGQMEAAVVTDVVAGSTIQTHYGLQKGDVILVLGQLTVKGNMSSPEEARDYLLYAYQRSEPVVILRGGEKLTLPLEPGAPGTAAAAAASTTTTADGSPTPTDGQLPAQTKPPKKPGGLEGQLDLIRNRPDAEQAE
jgi:hypothetical protein